MGIEVNWDNPERTRLVFRFDRAWTWLELRRKLRLSFAMTRTIDHAVGIVFDLTETVFLPEEPIAHVNGLMPHLPPNWSMIVVVSGASYAADIFTPIYTAYKDKGLLFLLVQSREQADAVISHEHRMRMTGARA